MGSDKAHDTEARDDETPQHPVSIGDFAIGQYPVTVAEYACAVRATAGRATAIREPPDYEYIGKTTDWKAQLATLDHPVVCVSWQDAAAYAWWLAGVTQQPWRLPTEAEWEKMARWDTRTGQGRIYPWGDTFDAVRCNSSASGIDTTTPVGRYPTGASPYGAQDVAGNVYEWASSLYRPYPYQQGDGREDLIANDRRVLRGGAWSGARGSRTASRTVDLTPNSLGDDIGFRLALAPLPAGSV
jgi:formylglycine-generating enzyme required for sulfatase activity